MRYIAVQSANKVRKEIKASKSGSSGGANPLADILGTSGSTKPDTSSTDGSADKKQVAAE